MATRSEILAWCDDTLQTRLFKDYAPNGLQVEGTEHIAKIAAAVTASRAAIEYAAEQGAQMLLVHHGMFWKSEPVTITGWKKERIAALLRHNINMAGYHLPLDAHPELGNNAQLAKLMGWETEYTCGEQNLLHIGRLKTPQTAAALAADLAQKLGREPVAAGDLSQTVSCIGWCTGGAQGFFQTALNEGAQVYVTGEISEAQYHLANETGAVFLSAGHHATERYGILALAQALQRRFNVETVFFDEQNPA
ncbi:Nif3-like dinuclear metal center hexameric protein [Neisseria sp. KEM232]|uniref:Nif3-like dinuclear metal center hexameric protein n=1 Tax=unclassified Neisseria TaxID=2623750 RepID=UPI00034DE9A2|nr:MULTISPECIES: Nif3-like dinuclear metal center hexameric protein [unclassified Neisseria]ASP17246.1 Nif3-like dinuclear metal center hexameric protein [Neisseria sp. KEM232]